MYVHNVIVIHQRQFILLYVAQIKFKNTNTYNFKSDIYINLLPLLLYFILERNEDTLFCRTLVLGVVLYTRHHTRIIAGLSPLPIYSTMLPHLDYQFGQTIQQLMLYAV